MVRPFRRPPRLLLALGLALLAAGCSGTKKLVDPVVVVHADGGRELAASTTYGVVFLGRTVRGGEVDLTSWFGDGPSLETTAVEPIGDGLYAAEAEIRLPSVPIAFETPRPGTRVRVLGRDGSRRWELGARVASDPRVEGLLLVPGGGLTGAPEQIGAGVYLGERPEELRLLGLVSGRIHLAGEDGARELVTVVGPESLWRLAARPAPVTHQRRWVYREDVL